MMSITRYFNGFSLNAVQNRILRHASASFSSSFLTSCRWWLAANSIWATLVVGTCVTVAFRIRIVKSWPLIALVILLSAGLVFRELWKSKLSVKTLLILILGFASTGFLLWPCLTRGAFVSVAGDPFFYSSFGQYVADHHRGFETGLSPIDQFGAIQSETRFGTASILGFFSILFHSTTVESLPSLTFIVLLNIFSGFVLLSRSFGCSRLFSLAAGLLSVVGGWTSDALHIGGYDNLLFLSLFPFLIIRLGLYRFGSKSRPTSLGLSMVAAAVFYVYPEGLAIAGVIFLPVFCQSVWSGIYRRERAWRHYMVSGFLILVLISPGIRVFISSLFEHIGIGTAKALGGLIFPGLLSSRFLPAAFGFGQEHPGITYLPDDLVLPILMVVFIVLGWATWIRRRKSLVLAFLIFIMMAVWQGLLVQYDYGLYKILFIGSLVWIPALFLGGTAVASFVPNPTRPFAATLGTIIFFSGAIAQRMEYQDKIPWTKVTPMKWYSDLAHLRHRVGNRPVLLVCDLAFHQEPTLDVPSSYFDQDWAVFFLRHVNLKVPEYIGMLGGPYTPVMQQAKSVSEPAAFVLVNGPVEGAVWKNERFSLLELADQARLIGVQAANGLEHVNGKPFVWLGNKASRFLIVSKIAQTAKFSAMECVTGPSRPENKDRQIRISIDGNVSQADVTGALSIEMPLKPGLNSLEIACQDAPAGLAHSDGAPRALPLGLWDYRISDK
jgi:hypothetical protein